MASAGCAHCGRLVRIQGQALERHTSALNGQPCPGSGQPPR